MSGYRFADTLQLQIREASFLFLMLCSSSKNICRQPRRRLKKLVLPDI